MKPKCARGEQPDKNTFRDLATYVPKKMDIGLTTTNTDANTEAAPIPFLLNEPALPQIVQKSNLPSSLHSCHLIGPQK